MLTFKYRKSFYLLTDHLKSKPWRKQRKDCDCRNEMRDNEKSGIGNQNTRKILIKKGLTCLEKKDGNSKCICVIV